MVDNSHGARTEALAKSQEIERRVHEGNGLDKGIWNYTSNVAMVS